MKAHRHFAFLPILALLPALSGADAGSAPVLPLSGPPPAVAPSTTAPARQMPTGQAKADKPQLLPSALAKVSAVNVPLTPRFQQIRDRIDALFHDRITTPPPPDPRFNPFRPPGAAAPVADSAASAVKAGAPSAPAVPSSSDVVLLQQAVALLKIKATAQRGGQMLLMINAGPGKEGLYKERDVISVNVQDQPVHLRIRQITRYSVMFSLNDAEYTLKF